jgi:hypothetical protein
MLNISLHNLHTQYQKFTTPYNNNNNNIIIIIIIIITVQWLRVTTLTHTGTDPGNHGEGCQPSSFQIPLPPFPDHLPFLPFDHMPHPNHTHSASQGSRS